MDADVAYADCALDAWASWVREVLSGYPAATLLGRIIEQGISGAAQHGNQLEGMPEEVLVTDKAVTRLDVIEKEVVMVYYLTYADSEIKAQECGCSRATFFRRITRAQKSVYRLIQSGDLLMRLEKPMLKHAGVLSAKFDISTYFIPEPA